MGNKFEEKVANDLSQHTKSHIILYKNFKKILHGVQENSNYLIQ